LAGIGALALSVGLAAVDEVPQWAVRPWLRRNHEPGLAAEIPRRYHLSGWNGFQLLSPTALGGPSDYLGDDNYWETVCSIGLAPLILAVIAMAGHPDRKLVRGWLVLAGVSVWFACGRPLGLYALMYSLVPGMGSFRVPARALFLANLAGAVLAGLGIATLRLQYREPRAWRRLAVRLAGALVVVIGVLSVFPLGSSRRGQAAANVLHSGGFWLTLSGVAALVVLGSLSIRRRNLRLAGRLLGLLALIELGWYGFALLHVAPARQFLGPDPISEALVNGRTRLRPSAGRNGSPGGWPSQDWPLRIKARDSFYGDLRAIMHDVEKTNVDDAFQIDHAAVLYETLYPVASRVRPMADRLLSPSAKDSWRRIRQAVFDRMSVTHLVSDRFEADPGWPVDVEGVWDGSPFVIQRNPTALPRAYVVPRVTLLPDHASVTLASFCDLDPRISVVMSRDPLGNLPPGPRQPFTAAQWDSTDPDRPALRVTTQAPGLLVLADTWMPGWTATVDGRPAPVLRGNHAQRVIPLTEPGCHTILLNYRPPGFALGCAITTVSALAWTLIGGLRLCTYRGARRDGVVGGQALRGPVRRSRAREFLGIPTPRRLQNLQNPVL
jgi:hypothetical protein